MFVRDGIDDAGVTKRSPVMEAATTPTVDVHPPDRIEDPTMADLKNRIAAGYEVDSEQVAREIVRKLRLIKWARHELVSAPGRTPGRPARGL
jgi:hypothetical protein